MLFGELDDVENQFDPTRPSAAASFGGVRPIPIVNTNSAG